jgi:hypothetical protein
MHYGGPLEDNTDWLFIEQFLLCQELIVQREPAWTDRNSELPGVHTPQNQHKTDLPV